MTRARPAPTPPKRRSARATQPADARSKLIEAALALMTDRPWERISARAIATEAGVDPALVTYHFGGRAGLVAAVAERAAALLRSRMTLGYDTQPNVEDAIRRATLDPVGVLAEAPLLGQLYVSELLLHGSDHSRALLAELAASYFADMDAAIEAAARRREVRRIDRSVLDQSIAALSLMPSFLGPLDRRRGRVVPASAHERLASDMVDVLLRGVGPDSRSRARRRTATPPVGGPRREEIVRSAIEMLRADIDAEISIDRVAAAAAIDPGVVAAHFPDKAALATAVARSAVRALPRNEQRPRTRGRPPVENPALESDLIAAATELVVRGGTRITANAVAARAGCDPALVTYYFKGRDGLLQAVAANALHDLVIRFDAGYDAVLPVVGRLETALRDPLHRLAGMQSLGQFLVDEFLVHGTKSSDAALGAVIAPYEAIVRECIAEGVQTGELRREDPETLFHAIAILPVYLVITVPVFERELGGPEVDPDPTNLVDQILDFVFRGVLSGTARRAAPSA